MMMMMNPPLWIITTDIAEEIEAQNEELMNNNSCIFQNEEPNVVAFFNDLEITETVEFPAGAVITSRLAYIYLHWSNNEFLGLNLI